MLKNVLFICIFFPTISFCNTMEKKPKVLVGAIVCQKPNILSQFLKSLKELETNNCTIEYHFLDLNSSDASRKLLEQFFLDKKNCLPIVSPKKIDAILTSLVYPDPYDLDEINKIAKLKDHLLQYTQTNNYDYLFLIDSPLAFHPKTVDQLVSNNKDIVANIFWNKEINDKGSLPQVWLSGQAELFSLENNEISKNFPQKELEERSQTFLTSLKKPGVYQVGGLANCVLISKKAIKIGINYRRIQNLTYWREEAHFGLRAEALKLPLHVDTHYPASLLAKAEKRTNKKDVTINRPEENQ